MSPGLVTAPSHAMVVDSAPHSHAAMRFWGMKEIRHAGYQIEPYSHRKVNWKQMKLEEKNKESRKFVKMSVELMNE